jgi:RiboL-PSP-HEPN
MAITELKAEFDKVDALAKSMANVAPISDPSLVSLRADFAGLLTVAMAASYENCVKQVILAYCDRHHSRFRQYAENKYSQLSSKVRVEHLHGYANDFGDDVAGAFKEDFACTKKRIEFYTGKNIEASLKQVMKWRHDFAHAWKQTTTLEEAITTHRYAKQVFIVFSKSFSKF